MRGDLVRRAGLGRGARSSTPSGSAEKEKTKRERASRTGGVVPPHTPGAAAGLAPYGFIFV